MHTKPNILLIMTDQHSPHIAGYVGNQWIDTPNLDRLATRSTLFDAAYCQSPLCVPSRMSMLTGKLAHRCDAYDNRCYILPDHETLPGWLAQHGYVTASVGKMHFVGAEQMHGWQQRPYGDLGESTINNHQPDPPKSVLNGQYFNHAIGRFPFAGPSAIPESLQQDRIVTTESLAWLQEYDGDQPWFFCASYARPHFPLTAPGRYLRKYIAKNIPLPPLPKNHPDDLHPHDRYIVDDFELTRFSDDEHRRALAAYYASVEYVDACIGDLLNGLEDAGILNNTIIVYISDHGDMAGDHGLWWKRTYYDASAQVPLLVSLPEQHEQQRISAPVELVDLFPTCCEWAGITSPDDLDGESLGSLLDRRLEDRRKHIARSELLGERPEVRFRMVRTARWKYVEFPISKPRLFDLQADPGENRDCYAAPPSNAPLADLQTQLAAQGSWSQINSARETARKRFVKPPPHFKSSSQYHLSDDRYIEADDHLYDVGDYYE